MRARVWLYAALILALGLRVYRLGYQSYWNDEGNSLGLAGRPAADIVRAAAADIHPPGYYLALKAWAALVGNSEVALRGFSALAGVVLVALLYRLGRQYFDRRAALAAAVLGAVNPFLIYYSQEARMYALLATLSAASFWLFSRWLRSSRPPARAEGQARLGVAYALVTAAGLYTHYAFGFVVLAQNVAALGGLLAHGRAPGAARGPLPWLPRFAAWVGYQALALALFAPWVPIARRQLTTWPVQGQWRPAGEALLDLARYLLFGRTLPLAAAAAGLAGGAVLLGLALRRRGQTVTPLLWLLMPAALTVILGVLNETFAKFLLAAVPAACLLLGHGLAAWGPAQPGGWGLWARRGLVGAAGAAVALSTGAALNHLYFDPAYFRDDYRGIARTVAALARPGDAIITISPNQVEAFGYYHRAGAPVYPLPATRPIDVVATEQALAGIASRHDRIFVLYWGETQADPDQRVEQWLNTHAFKAAENWYGQVRLATYAVAAPAPVPSALSGARFGEHITLMGYHTPTTALAPGDILQITLFWQADAPLAERYKVFVHLYADPAQPPVAQRDGEPRGGLLPTSEWQPGQLVADNHGVLIPPDLPPGDYRLYIGLYELFSGARLPISLNEAGAGDRLDLGTVTLE